MPALPIDGEFEGQKLPKLCHASLQKLADSHIHLYERRLNGPRVGINEKSCRCYLEIWRKVKKAADYDDLIEACKDEVDDAHWDGGYNHLLLPEERVPED